MPVDPARFTSVARSGSTVPAATSSAGPATGHAADDEMRGDQSGHNGAGSSRSRRNRRSKGDGYERDETSSRSYVDERYHHSSKRSRRDRDDHRADRNRDQRGTSGRDGSRRTSGRDASGLSEEDKARQERYLKRKAARTVSSWDMPPLAGATVATVPFPPPVVGMGQINPARLAMIQGDAPYAHGAGGLAYHRDAQQQYYGGGQVAPAPIMRLHHAGYKGGAGSGGGGGSSSGGGNTLEPRSSRRIYVGNVPHHADQQSFSTCISNAIEAKFPDAVAANPQFLISVTVNPAKQFGFLEFQTAQMATDAISLNGNTEYLGNALRFKRPSDYVPPPGGDPAASVLQSVAHQQQAASSNDRGAAATVGGVSTQVPNGPNKIFAGGLPRSLTRDELIELFKAYGELKGMHLVTDRDTGESKGYCFFEYADPAMTLPAIEGLHELPLGDRVITVRLSENRPPGSGPSGATHGSATNAPPGLAMMPQLMQMQQMMMSGGMVPGLPVPPTQNAAMPGKAPTKVLVLLDMVTAEDLTDDQEYQEIFDDIQSECATHGTVVKVVIPRSGPFMCKVFVEFSEPAGAVAARQACEGREFDGRIVKADYMSEQEFLSVA